MTKRIFQALLVGLIPGLSACATASRIPETGPVTLQVSNAYPASVDVYVLFDGFKKRMGTVSTAQEAHFQVPDGAWDSVTGMRLVIDPIGSTAGYVTEQVRGVEPGSTIEVEVASDLAATWYQVKRGAPTPQSAPAPLPSPPPRR